MGGLRRDGTGREGKRREGTRERKGMEGAKGWEGRV